MTNLIAGRTRRLTARVALVLGGLIAASAAEAQSVRYISINGNDANACTRTAPCRTLARGVQSAPVRGEVRLLNSGSFGAGVTIAKSLTVSGDGATLMLSGPVTVAASAARVVFRGLLFNGFGTTTFGVRINNANSVHIVECEFERFTDDGIFFDVATTELLITNTISRNNNDNGLHVDGNGSTKVVLENFRAENNVNGVFIQNAQMSVSNSTLSGNSADGIQQHGGTSNVVSSTAANNGASGFTVVDGGTMQLDSSVSRGNFNGLFVGNQANTVARISNLSVTDNSLGIQNNGTTETDASSTVFSNGVNPADDVTGNALVNPANWPN
jgi:hypothetical protein